MNFKQFLIENAEAVLAQITSIPIPAAPGTVKLPPNYVRLYHYTKAMSDSDQSKFEAAQKLRTNGIQIGMAKGNSYGEPNVVWASSQMPGQHMVFAEFGMKMDDDRWLQGKPDPKMSAAQYEKMHWDCYFQGSILSREIIAVHEPWHQKYRYMLANDLIEKAKAGEYDMLLQNNEYGPAVYKAKHS